MQAAVNGRQLSNLNNEPANPDVYVAALDGWQQQCVASLRVTVRASAELEEVVKWGHLVYLSNGPVLLIRAEDERVLFGFWRGQRLLDIEKRLKPGGKYEMATLELHENTLVDPVTVRRLTKEAVALNAVLGNPAQAHVTKRPGRSNARAHAPLMLRNKRAQSKI